MRAARGVHNDALDGWPMFAPAYMGQEDGAKPHRTLMLCGQTDCCENPRDNGVKAFEKIVIAHVRWWTLGHPYTAVWKRNLLSSRDPRVRVRTFFSKLEFSNCSSGIWVEDPSYPGSSASPEKSNRGWPIQKELLLRMSGPGARPHSRASAS